MFTSGSFLQLSHLLLYRQQCSQPGTCRIFLILRRMQAAPILNKEQQKAITDPTKRLLVLAGAGAGKTRTLTEKIHHLVFEKGVPAHRILAITFTRNAANEMLDRLIEKADPAGRYGTLIENATTEERYNLRRTYKQRTGWINQLQVHTFHSFCYQLLRREGVKEFDNRFRLLTDESFYAGQDSISVPLRPEEILRQQMLMQAADNTDYLLLLKWYLVDYYGGRIEREHKARVGPQDERFLKPYAAMDGTQVRSKSELFIADWLYRHGISYLYEPRVNVRPHSMRPDFYIPAADLYIEHVSNLSANTQIKKESLRFAARSVGHLFEEDFIDLNRYSQSLDALLRHRLNHHITAPQGLAMESILSAYTPYVDDLVKLMKRVIDLVKVEAESFDTIMQKAQADPHERVFNFYKLLQPVWAGYHAFCTEKSLLDFNDLILKTVNAFTHHTDLATKFKKQYDYILIDEFQDVNNLQVQLVRRLLNRGTQLFCVGDDWQSIYSFRGAVVDYVVRFNHYFPAGKTLMLAYNYRSNKTIVDAGNEVIKFNKFKVDKKIKAFNTNTSHITVYVSQQEQNDGAMYVADRIEELLKGGLEPDDILLLSRRHNQALPYNALLKDCGLPVRGKTIHASKGLEAKVVFVVGLRQGSGGFPDLWMNDRIFQVIRQQDVERMMEEERRLFYVAITRAREQLFLITEAGSESQFISEIPPSFVNREHMRLESKPAFRTCPACGHLLIRPGNFCEQCGTALT